MREVLMGLTRADLVGEMTEEERASRKFWIDRTMANDVWAKKIFNKVGILLTGHQANRPYIKACVETHSKLGFWITLAYDNYVDPTWAEIDHNRFMPGKETLDKVDMFLMPHYQTWGGVAYPYFWLLKFGVESMQQFDYIYCTNSDFILEKPEGFPELFALMGDADIMTSGPDYERAANTAGFIAKASALRAIVKHMQDHFIPWDVYEKYTQELGNTEGRFGRAIKDLGLKKVTVTPPADDMFKVPGKGTWYDLIGFRHIHAEHNHAYRNKGIPPDVKYLDSRFMGDEYRQIKEYWETKDMKILENWWAK
jgi:hypothetical protein